MTDLIGLDADYAFDLCKMVLAALNTYWPTELTPLPARQFVASGIVFFEEPCVAVGLSRQFSVDGDVSLEQRSPYEQLARRAATIEASVIRNVPDIRTAAGGRVYVPTSQQQEDSAKVLYADSITVWNVVQTAHKRQGLGAIDGVAFQDWTPIGPEGSVGGGITTFLALLL